MSKKDLVYKHIDDKISLYPQFYCWNDILFSDLKERICLKLILLKFIPISVLSISFISHEGKFEGIAVAPISITLILWPWESYYSVFHENIESFSIQGTVMPGTWEILISNIENKYKDYWNPNCRIEVKYVHPCATLPSKIFSWSYQILPFLWFMHLTYGRFHIRIR